MRFCNSEELPVIIVNENAPLFFAQIMNSFTFIDIGNVGTNAKEVTGGISEALVSTAFGLIIAIITIIFLSYFNNCRNKEMFLIEEFSLKLRSFYFKSYK